MREINNNNFDVKNVQKPELKPTQTPAKSEPVENEEKKEIKDFSNPTEVLGRAQVSKADNLKQDVALMKKNPDVVESANKFFDMAYAQLSAKKDPEAYEKAATMASLYAEEISK